MKKVTTLLAALFMISLASAAFAQNPEADASANASATIITPISIEKVEEMDLLFGNIIASVAGGTVAIDVAGSPSYSGVSAPATTGDRQQAQFLVTGFADSAFAITLPTSATIENQDSDTMTVDNFVSDPSGTSALENGEKTINVGATLNVGANQAAGEYTGTFDVTVN